MSSPELSRVSLESFLDSRRSDTYSPPHHSVPKNWLPTGEVMTRMLFRCVLIAILVCLPAFVTPAGADITRFDLSGTVTDGTGGVLPGVTVTLKNADTGFNRSAVTDAAGRYAFNAVDPTGKWAL